MVALAFVAEKPFHRSMKALWHRNFRVSVVGVVVLGPAGLSSKGSRPRLLPAQSRWRSRLSNNVATSEVVHA